MAMNTFRSIILVAATMLCTAAMAQQKTLDECVYWIDHDISTSQPLGPSGVSIDVSSLSRGLHAFTMQVKDSEGLWSGAVTKYFVTLPDEVEGSTIVARQFWFDNDISNAQILGESVATVDLSNLSKGLHSYTMRVQDDAGLWSSTITKYFVILDVEDIQQVNIVRYMYWIDADVDNAQICDIQASKGETFTGVVEIDVSTLLPGEHMLSWMMGDDRAVWSQIYTEAFTIEPKVGDINLDGSVDVTDVNIVINVILGKDQAENYDGRCNLNDDDTIDVSDVNAVINIILGKY